MCAGWSNPRLLRVYAAKNLTCLMVTDIAGSYPRRKLNRVRLVGTLPQGVEDWKESISRSPV